jgi:type IV pilus assembly protein PilW
MVAITIGLILLGGVFTIFMSNKQSYRVQENMGRVQENGRFAIDIMARTLRMTGWQGDNVDEWQDGSLSAANGGVLALTGTNNEATVGILAGSDTITVIYQGNTDGFVKDCLGNTVPVGVNLQNTFRVNTTAGGVVGAPAGSVGQLECVTTNGGTVITSALIDGVEGFQIQYGIDTDNDRAANSYVSGDNVTDSDDVISVRITLLLMTNADRLAVIPANNTYNLLDFSFTEPGDERLRRQFSTTINMRNRL